MAEDPAALQAQLAELQTQLEILQRQKQIADLQAQMAALQQQTAAPAMPSPSQVTAPTQVLQQLAPQSAKLAQQEVDVPQPVESGNDAVAGVADAVGQASKAVEEIWKQGEAGLSSIFFKDYEVEAPADTAVPDWIFGIIVALILSGIGLQMLSLGDLLGEASTAGPSGDDVINSLRKRRSTFIRGRPKEWNEL